MHVDSGVSIGLRILVFLCSEPPLSCESPFPLHPIPLPLCRQIVHLLGGRVVSNPHRCTHFVTVNFIRTVNILVCIARGCHVAVPDWLLSSKQAKQFVDAWPYTLQSKAKEAEAGFHLRASLEAARKQQLLEGWHVLITPHCKPDVPSLTSMVTAAGGKVRVILYCELTKIRG